MQAALSPPAPLYVVYLPPTPLYTIYLCAFLLKTAFYAPE